MCYTPNKYPFHYIVLFSISVFIFYMHNLPRSGEMIQQGINDTHKRKIVLLLENMKRETKLKASLLKNEKNFLLKKGPLVIGFLSILYALENSHYTLEI